MSNYPIENIWTLGNMTAPGYGYSLEEKLCYCMNIGASQTTHC